MNNTTIAELQKAISQIKKEIKEKEEQLDDLIEEYQQLSNIDIEDNLDEETLEDSSEK